MLTKVEAKEVIYNDLCRWLENTHYTYPEFPLQHVSKLFKVQQEILKKLKNDHIKAALRVNRADAVKKQKAKQ